MQAKPITFKDGPSKTDEANPRFKFYVTMIRSGTPPKVARLAGPFDHHEDAIALVVRARAVAQEVDPRSAWDAFGTSGIESDNHRPGVLNERLGLGQPAAENARTELDASSAVDHVLGPVPGM
ncbi:MAG: hypothetical protein HKL99_14090 [Burkholderiales bacterium]|nr:hypothetical protein [Burkholderiales bacterium]